jgi:glycosyltransferase involved in cell wall biosynthesis
MKVSIIIAILNSHKVVIRQLRHFKRMNLSNDIEFIFVDDGSNPPLKYSSGLCNFQWLYTNDKRPWTQGLARNLGASKAKGEYFLFTDIDHIITREAIEAVRAFDGDKMVFVRYFGVLDARGNIICDAQSMLNFGLDKGRYKRRGLCGGIHGNTYAIKSDIFRLLNGYDRKYCESGFHVGGIYMSEERNFNIRYNRLVRSGHAKPPVTGPDIYCYPIGRFRTDKNHNPNGLFHTLSLEQTPQPPKP